MKQKLWYTYTYACTNVWLNGWILYGIEASEWERHVLYYLLNRTNNDSNKSNNNNNNDNVDIHTEKNTSSHTHIANSNDTKEESH
jgi:hypothetical protein